MLLPCEDNLLRNITIDRPACRVGRFDSLACDIEQALLDVIVAGFARHAEDAGSEYEGEALELLPILLSPSDGGVAADDAVASAVQARTLAQVVDAKWPAHLSIHVATVSLYLFFVSNI